jgi:hypothetical protein
MKESQKERKTKKAINKPSKMEIKLAKAGIPADAIFELKNTYFNAELSNLVDFKAFRDPYVDGTIAMRVTRMEGTLKNPKPYVFDLLWFHGGFDEVEFTSWPPTSKW